MPTVHTPETAYWTDLAKEVAQLPRGQRTARMREAAKFKGLSLQSAWRKVREIGGFMSEREKRSDKGGITLTRAQAELVSGLVMKSRNAKGKNGMPMKRVLDILHHSPDVEFPEIAPSTAWRCLMHYRLHPEQLLQARASAEIRTEGPNDMFQVDVSICRVYYLPNGSVSILREQQYNRNKPENLEKIRHDRALRYVGVDHASGAFKVLYIRGSGETQENMFEFLCYLFGQQPGIPFHGVPEVIYWDMGAHQRATSIKNLLRCLGVRNLAHEAENPQATGAVEVTHKIIETHFEAGLRFLPVADVNGLNTLAENWARMYCSSPKYAHSRHGKTRYDMWQTIKTLRECPAREILQTAMNTKPETRKIEPKFNGSIRFAIPGYGSQVYADVLGQIPGVCVGDTVDVTVNLYQVPEILVMLETEGQEIFYALKPRETDDYGYSTSAPLFGEGVQGARLTEADKNRQALDMLATGADTAKQAKQALKKNTKPLFEGTGIDPMADVKARPAPEYLPKRGKSVDMAQQTTHRLLAYPQVWARVMTVLGREPSEAEVAKIREWYPQGIPESELEGLTERLGQDKPQLRIVA